MKSKVYKGELGAMDELRQRIFLAAEDIRNNPKISRQSVSEFLKWCIAFCLASGGRFEQYRWKAGLVHPGGEFKLFN